MFFRGTGGVRVFKKVFRENYSSDVQWSDMLVKRVSLKKIGLNLCFCWGNSFFFV